MREISIGQAVVEAQMEEMERDPNTFLIGLDVGLFGGVLGECAGLYQKFGSQSMVYQAVEAAEALAKEGISAEMMMPVLSGNTYFSIENGMGQFAAPTRAIGAFKLE